MQSFPSRLFATLLRFLILGVGLVFAAVLLLMGLLFTLGLLVWGVIRGRPPTIIKFRVDPRAPWAGMRRGAAPPAPKGEVVDIEARDVSDTPPNLPRE